MKKIIFGMIGLVFFAACSTPMHTTVYIAPEAAPAPAPQPPPEPPANSFQVFYDALGPYGTWIDYPNYGYVWSPNVGPDFRPYATNGHWVYSDDGWTWVSNYSWGWAAFHYGRWFFEDGYGWLWLPGHEWAPAWVTWGRSGNYYGWAPIEPKVDIAVGWTPPATSWNFVQAQHITRPDVVNYVMVHNNTTVINNITKNVTIINNTTINNHVTNNTTVNNHGTNVIYNRGPEVNEVENVTNTKIPKVTINENNRPGTTSVTNNNLNIYRPVIKPAAQQPKDKAKPKPQNVQKYQQKNKQ